jgi:hypothetical protein
MILALLLAAAPAAPPPRFDAIRFFTGASRGEGHLKVILSRPRAVRVQSRGVVGPGGVLTLDQRIEEEGKPPRTRRWRIREVAPGRYSGTLTDAVGPIVGKARGDRLTLRYRAKGGVAIEQRLTLAPDGRSALNRLSAKKFGVPVARLTETIRRLDGSRVSS